MEFSDYNFFGVALAPFIIGVIALLRNETGIGDYLLDWLGALLFAFAAVFSITEVQAVLAGEAAVTVLRSTSMVVQIVTTWLGVLLTVKGYWPTARSGTSGDEYNAMAVSGGKFFSKY